MGLVNNFLLCLCKGVPLALLGPEDFVKKPILWLEGLARTRSTVSWSPNFGYALTTQRIRDQDLEGLRLDCVRAFWNAAERIHSKTIHAFARRFEPFGVRLANMRTNFGCAENAGGATFSDPDRGFVSERVDRRILHEEGRAQPVSVSDRNEFNAITVVGVGKPAPGISISILSRQRELLPDGFVGDVALDTPSRMEGYLVDESATQRAFQGNLLRTGDLGYLRNGDLLDGPPRGTDHRQGQEGRSERSRTYPVRDRRSATGMLRRLRRRQHRFGNSAAGDRLRGTDCGPRLFRANRPGNPPAYSCRA